MITPPDLGVLLASTGGPAALSDELGASTFPLALFPVRLETRFVPTDGGRRELRVRVYPDKVHIESHDSALTADELVWGQRYWTLQWQAGTDDTALRAAWRMLADRFGAPRAAWIARALTPSNAASRPTGTPRFPDLGPPATTARTPLARLLPTRWIATVYAAGAVTTVVSGTDIPADLAIGPDLAEALAPDAVNDDEPAVDDGMRWMIDFERAEHVGMALRIPLPAPLPTPAVDVLLVAGMRDGDASDEVAAQFDAHHYTDGLAVLPAGTPTNNTTVGRTAYQAADPQHDRSYLDEWGPAPGPGAAASALAGAFGVSVFDTITMAADTDLATARAMTTALWPATWGYYLSQMIGVDGPLTEAGRDWGRSHAIEHVLPGGPLPVLRCGRQPYGLLPATSLDGWTPTDGDPAAGPSLALRDLLISLRDKIWRRASVLVPRIGMSPVPSADLVDLLRAGPVSGSYLVRGLMGQHFLQHLWAFLGVELDFSGFWEELVAMSTEQARSVGLGFVPPLAHAAYDESSAAVTAPSVGDRAYIADLLAADLDQLARAELGPGTPLLQVLMRHALLRQYTEAAARLLNSPETPFAQLVRDAELVDLLPGQPPAPTWSWLRSRHAPGDGATVAQRLASNPGGDIARLRAAFQVLATSDPAVLERHLAGTLDAGSHRLDAWVTSLASRRLAELRTQHPHGLAVGGYGWVENLNPQAAWTAAPTTPDEPVPLAVYPNDPGFVHAPSLNQASAAALLRNAHLAHGGEDSSPYAIELTSARIRLARQLFDGVRQGQPLAALLGYIFERGLHEADLDELVDDFRGAAPLPGAQGTRLVVDGLELSKRWAADPATLLEAVAGLSVTDPRRPTLTRVLDALGNAVDSAADAVSAEGAFQMVRGNFSRAASSLDAISSGQATPPDLGFVRTPRTGIGLTHRVAMLFPVTAATSGTSPRATAEPTLAVWADRLLGSIGDRVAHVDEVGPEGAVLRTRDVALSELNLTPIDLIWAAGTTGGAPPEIAARLLDTAVHADGGPDPDANLRVRLGELGTVVELAGRAQRFLATSRPLDGADLQAPHQDPERGLDLDEYEQRAVAAEHALAQAQAELTNALATGAGLREAMLAVAAFGMTGAVPALGVPLDVQARGLLPELARRLAPPSSAGPTDAPPDEAARAAALLDRFRAVFGPGFLALPHFTAANAADVAASRADAGALLGDDQLAAYTWLTRMSRVRAPLAAMGHAFVEAEALKTGEALDLAVAQIPHISGQRWVGLDQPDGAPPVDGRISLVLQGAPADLGGRLCGLLVDELTEVVPSRSETTGVAFQYDPPDAAAPQAILLAVPPVVGEPWRVGSLNRVLLETMDIARIRGVDPRMLGDIAHYLPATYLAFNVAGDTVSADLNRLVQG